MSENKEHNYFLGTNKKEKRFGIMKGIVKNSVKYISVYIITAAVLLGLLVAAAMIPQSSIRDNMKKSAEFLCEDYVYIRKAGKLNGGDVDRYADAILLNIAYQYDSKDPLRSVMWSAYYDRYTYDKNINLLEAVTEGHEANQQYLRYWHGSNVIVRTLHLILSLKGIYILNAVLLSLLAAFIFFLLLKEKAYVIVAGLVAAFATAMVWIVPYSLEYTWNFYIMLIMTIIVLIREKKNRGRSLGIPFMICGMLTCFLDFLTTELLTLFVPLLVVMYFRWRGVEAVVSTDGPKKKKDDRGTLKYTTNGSVFGWKAMAVPVIAWGAGYAFMWLTKWITASIVLGENVMPYVKENLEERVSGYVGLGTWEYLKNAISKNISTLLPWALGGFGIVAVIVLIFVAFYFCFVYKKKIVRRTLVWMYAAVAVIPYVRYLVLHNHAYLHYFFTFRTQIVTILAVFLIAGEMIDWELLKHENKKKRRT